MPELHTLALLVGVRTIDGSTLDTPPTAMLTWKLDCLECSALLVALDRSGLPVVAINLDGADRRSSVRARAASLTMPVVADPDGMLRRDLGLSDEPSVWLPSEDCRLRRYTPAQALVRLREALVLDLVVACRPR